MVPRTLPLNGGAKEGAPCEDSRDPRRKEVKQVDSEENELGYLNMMPLEL